VEARAPDVVGLGPQMVMIGRHKPNRLTKVAKTMSDSDIRDKLRPAPPTPWDADLERGPAGAGPSAHGFTSAAQWGLAALLIGCTLLVVGCVTLVFNVLLFRGGPVGIPVALALAGALIGTVVVSALGLAGLVFGVLGWQQAYAHRSCPALGIAGALASGAGLLAWLIAATDLVAILNSFPR
jgi:hypothetical protein